MQEKLKFSKSQGASTPAEIQRMQNIPSASAVGSIMYVMRCDAYWTAVKNILKYLCNTKDMFLVYEGNMKRELRISCYIDAGYLMDADDMKSQTRYVFVLNGGVVDWKSTKQTIFATSSTDVEYIAAFDALKEAVWIRKFISRLGVVPTIKEPINMYCDNTRAIAIAKDHGVTKGARHFCAKVHYLRETIEMGDVKIEKVDTDDNLADPFTKALAFPKYFELTEKIGMIPATASTTLVVNKEFVPPLDMCSKIPWALSRINQIIAWPCPKDVANYQYIRKPATPTAKWELLEYGGSKSLKHHEEKNGFSMMLGSLDCTDWEWFCYPYRQKGQYVRRDHGSNPLILLEVVASQDLWICHAFFGVSGSNNDINVLHQSPLFNNLKPERAPEIPFVANGVTYPWGYYLVDGIYPELVTFVKTIPEPSDDDHKRIRYKQMQESARKFEKEMGYTSQSRMTDGKGKNNKYDVYMHHIT
ncbi:retrotransposon protein, putative, ty1-copia subclass [Tanacetum coccineum]